MKILKDQPKDHNEQYTLGDAIGALLEECRMILPGVQALFGFQLIAVFNQGFGEKLSAGEQVVHLLALALVAISGALIMAPAAYHRQTAPRMEASDGFMVLASRLLLVALAPLMLGIALDFYLISHIILKDSGLSLVLSILLFAVFVIAWYLMPHMGFFQRMTGKAEE